MKDSIHLANMLRRFTREKEEMRKKNLAAAGLPRPTTKVPAANSALLNTHPKAPGGGGGGGNDCNMADLTTDPAVMSLLGTANNDLLQDMMGDLDFGMLDSPQPASPVQGENGMFGTGHKASGGRASQGAAMTPPLPGGLPGPLAKRIEDLRAVRTLVLHRGLEIRDLMFDVLLNVQHRDSVLVSLVQASRLFDEEGRKKFFTLDMNNILLE